MASILLSKLDFSLIGGTVKGGYGSKSGNENCVEIISPSDLAIVARTYARIPY